MGIPIENKCSSTGNIVAFILFGVVIILVAIIGVVLKRMFSYDNSNMILRYKIKNDALVTSLGSLRDHIFALGWPNIAKAKKDIDPMISRIEAELDAVDKNPERQKTMCAISGIKPSADFTAFGLTPGKDIITDADNIKNILSSYGCDTNKKWSSVAIRKILTNIRGLIIDEDAWKHVWQKNFDYTIGNIFSVVSG